MANNKTKAESSNVAAFLDRAPRSQDAHAIAAMMVDASGEPATMWRPSIVGFGMHRYKYESGREGEIFRIGFSPRKGALTLYGMGIGRNAAIVARLGKHTTGKGCVYIKKLDDVERGALTDLIAAAWASRD